MYVLVTLERSSEMKLKMLGAILFWGYCFVNSWRRWKKDGREVMGMQLMMVALRVEDRVLLQRRTGSLKVATNLMWDSSLLIAGTS